MARALLAMALAMLVVGAAPTAQREFDLEKLAGDWIMEENGVLTGEHWSEPEGGSISGEGKSGSGGTLKITETMRIAPDKRGTLIFWAKPAGATTETPFTLVRSDAQQLMFENLKHDYPQRIIYFRDGGWLFAKIMVADGSKEQDFVYRPANPVSASRGEPLPTAKDVAEAVTSSRRCIDNGYTLCLPPTRTVIRNLVCWPMTDLGGYIVPYRDSPAAECSFESHEKQLGPASAMDAADRPVTWRASWARLHHLASGDCTGSYCARSWIIPRD